MTSVSLFETQYRQFIDAILAIPSVTGLAVANIPDVTTVPFATTVPPFVVNPLTQQPILVDGKLVPLLGPDGPLRLPSATGPGDLVTLFAIPALEDGVGIPDFIPGGTGEPLTANLVITEEELGTIEQRTQDLNQVIDTVTREKDVVRVDAWALYHEVQRDGYGVGGIEYTSEFLAGGLFSLDGIHPWTLAYGVLANAFIDAINRRYEASIPYSNFELFLDVNFRSDRIGGGGSASMGDLAPGIEAMLASPWAQAGYALD